MTDAQLDEVLTSVPGARRGCRHEQMGGHQLLQMCATKPLLSVLSVVSPTGILQAYASEPTLPSSVST